jgi:hypothetical protein
MPFAVLFAAGAAVTMLVRRWGVRGPAPVPVHPDRHIPRGAPAPDRKTLDRIERAIRDSL